MFSYINAQNNNDIIIGKIDNVNSKILNENRKILVHVPKDNPYDKNTYPVVYLLDGDAHFYSVVGMIRQLSSVNGNTICPKMIVVGISNTDRTRDLSPTKGESVSSGGGDNFIAFIEKELIPYIDSKYPTIHYRTFIGHSLGGLTVMNSLVKKPELFNAYVAIDPSMWWDNENLLNEIKTIAFRDGYNNKTLFLGIANTIRNGKDIVNVQNDTTQANRHIRAILKLNSYLMNNTQMELSFKGKYYEDNDHGSVPLIAEYDALRFIFDFYGDFKLSENDYLNPNIDILGKLEEHYNKLSKGFGIKIIPNEFVVDDLGKKLLRKKQFEKAYKVFQMNINNYPNSSNTNEAMGDYYMAIGKNEKAIKSYKKAVSISDDSFLKEKIIKLENN